MILTAIRTTHNEYIVLHGNGRNADDGDGLLGKERLGGISMGWVLWGRIVVVAVRVVVWVLLWGIMALVSMVWVHDTVLNGIVQV